MYNSGNYSITSLLLVATIGNTLGGVITYWIGGLLRSGLRNTKLNRKIEKWFGNDKDADNKAMERVKKWGVPALLFSWMPVIGDPLCLAAGYLRLSFWPSALMILLGKFMRYVVLLWAFVQI